MVQNRKKEEIISQLLNLTGISLFKNLVSFLSFINIKGKPGKVK